MGKSNKMIGHFEEKPLTDSFWQLIDDFVCSLGPVEKSHTSLVSYSVNRKFLWMWAYEQTPDGRLFLTVLLDRKLDDENLAYVKQVSKNRWNHHVIITSCKTCRSEWLRTLITSGFEFARS